MTVSEYLPYGGLEWLKNVDGFDVMSISEKSETGYNLKYFDELDELHNDYLLSPEKLAVSSEMLSKYCKENADRYGIKVGDVKHYNFI